MAFQTGKISYIALKTGITPRTLRKYRNDDSALLSAGYDKIERLANFADVVFVNMVYANIHDHEAQAKDALIAINQKISTLLERTQSDLSVIMYNSWLTSLTDIDKALILGNTFPIRHHKFIFEPENSRIPAERAERFKEHMLQMPRSVVDQSKKAFHDTVKAMFESYVGMIRGKDMSSVIFQKEFDLGDKAVIHLHFDYNEHLYLGEKDRTLWITADYYSNKKELEEKKKQGEASGTRQGVDFRFQTKYDPLQSSMVLIRFFQNGESNFEESFNELWQDLLKTCYFKVISTAYGYIE